MLQLRRVLLDCVGHPNARFAPLELSLIDEQRRPTHAVVWLRNGGGKSSLLNLLFAVVRPHRREFLGGNEDGKDRRLGDYVLDGDTSHVCIEWGRPGARTPSLVTGMVLEWRDRTRVADESRLRRLWYAFVPSDHRDPGLLDIEPTLTFDMLPVTEDDRRLSLTRFRDRLRAAAATDPSLRLVTPTSQAEWRRELEQHDLDPEVLRYQLQMNREEGGASELFKRRCRTATDFVDLLVELAVADERSDRVADVYTRYADQLARRPDIERNREFLAGALERLGPVAELDAAHDAAHRRLRQVVTDAAAVASGLRGAGADVRGRATAHRADAVERRRAAAAYAATEEQLRDSHRELVRLAAHLDVRDAARRHAEAQAALTAGQERLTATSLLEPLARLAALDAQIAALDDAAATEPSTTTRQLVIATAQLADRLRRDVARSMHEAERLHDLASHAERRAEGADRDARTAAAERGRLEQSLITLRGQAATWDTRMTALRDRGAIEGDEDLGRALARAREALASGQAARADARRRADALDDEIRAAYTTIAGLDDQLGDARARADARAHQQRQMRDAAASLAADERLRSVAETDDVDVWHSGAALAEHLGALVGDADRALADDAVRTAGDRAALVGLQTDGLLPPRSAVAQVVAALETHGIASQPGWRHLADRVTAEHRTAVVARHPALMDGVVVTDRALLERARSVVADLTAPLRSVVVIGPPPTRDTATRAHLVAPVDPALYDRSHAESARARLQSSLEDADRRRGALVSARDRDAVLSDRLRRLLQTYPPGRREQIDDEAARAQHACDHLRAERDATAARLDDLERRRAATPADSDDGVRRLSETVADLDALADSRIDPARLEALTARHRAAGERATEAARRVEDHRRAGAEHLLAAQRHRDDAARIRDELAGLDVSTSSGVTADLADDTTANSHSDDDTRPADVLRERVDALRAAVDADRSHDALAERRRSLLERRAELDRELRGADDAAVRAAQALAREPAATDRRSRADMVRRAERDRDAALEARAEALERLRAARAALPDAEQDVDGAVPSDAQASREEIPSAAQARRRADEQLAEADRARASAEQERRLAADAEARAAADDQLADRFDHLAELLTIELRARPTVIDADDRAPTDDVPREPERARAAVDELRDRIASCASEAERATKAVAGAAAELRRFVTADRFAVLDGPIRTRLAGDPAAVARREPELVEELRVRLTQCEQTLDELTSHRRLLVREIAADAQRGLWLLRQADQVSALPSGFGEWSDQRFLHIRFTAPAVDDALFERLEAMVDDLVDRGIRPAGVPLLQRAVHAAVGSQGFAVQILKPNPGLHPQRVDVTELATFSGGEQLTAAILLYCTLARLRAQSRQTLSAAGVLTLDNPIGKSSNVTLLSLQRRVADAMGVQLVYTTAVDDREAVGVLPHWIRLRNERRDRRSGNLHVEHADTGAGRSDVEQGRIEATHMWRRADEVAPVPGSR